MMEGLSSRVSPVIGLFELGDRADIAGLDFGDRLNGLAVESRRGPGVRLRRCGH